MIINESRRLYCPAVQIARTVHKEVGLGKFILPASTEIVVPIGAVHHSPGIWGEDASHFKPERFADGVAKATTWLHFLHLEWGLGIVWGQTSQLLKQRLRSQ
ncbi:hypothetical protein D5086_029889 [Populus alba]|uniref:Uncharacterized protein n=2 Tax=Populus TaxID=3689 RepID=A0ACC4ALY3_POPAL